MSLTLDNRTQTIVQVAVSVTLYLVMLVAWRTQRTYPGFGRWTHSKLPNALGWLLVSLRGLIPDWASVVVGNIVLFSSPLLLFEGIRQFRGKPSPRLVKLWAAGFAGHRVCLFHLGAAQRQRPRLDYLPPARWWWSCAAPSSYSLRASGSLRPSYWFTGSMFASFWADFDPACG